MGLLLYSLARMTGASKKVAEGYRGKQSSKESKPKKFRFKKATKRLRRTARRTEMMYKRGIKPHARKTQRIRRAVRVTTDEKSQDATSWRGTSWK